MHRLGKIVATRQLGQLAPLFPQPALQIGD
jgi:hypothetical protein